MIDSTSPVITFVLALVTAVFAIVGVISLCMVIDYNTLAYMLLFL